MSMTLLHFKGLNDKSHLSNQMPGLFRSSCRPKLSVSFVLVSIKNTVISKEPGKYNLKSRLCHLCKLGTTKYICAQSISYI